MTVAEIAREWRDLDVPECFKVSKMESAVLEFKNGVRALVLSSPEVDRAGYCVGVPVGVQADPREYQGLAHFLEHMLFMGSEKYPEEDEFQNFVARTGGECNAFTSAYYTVYYALTGNDRLDELVDRLTDYFIKPLLLEHSVDREVEAVNSEYELSLTNDESRFYHVFKTAMVNPEHPYSQFFIGNNDSLRRLDLFPDETPTGENPPPAAETDKPSKALSALRAELVKFHDKWYSSNGIVAVILGNQGMDELKDMISKRLTRIPNHQTKFKSGKDWLEIDGHPCKPFDMTVGKELLVTPIRPSDRRLYFHFAVEDNFDLWREKPGHIAGHLLGFEGEGSILKVLKELQLATGLMAGIAHENCGESVFFICVQMTDKGLSDKKTIGEVVFSRIKQIVSDAERHEKGSVKGSSEERSELRRVLDELRVLDHLGFKYSGLPNPSHLLTEYIRLLMKNRDDVPNLLKTDVVVLPEKKSLFKDGSTKDEGDPDAPVLKCLMDLLKRLTPQNLSISCSAKAHESQCNQVTKYYNVKYALRDIDPELLNAWQAAFDTPLTDRHKLTPMPVNRYIPTRLSLMPEIEDKSAFPQLVETQYPALKVWHQTITRFKLPQATCELKLYLPHLLYPRTNETQCATWNLEAAGQLKLAVEDEAKKAEVPRLMTMDWPMRVLMCHILADATSESLNSELYDARLARLNVDIHLRDVANSGLGLPAIEVSASGFDDRLFDLVDTVLHRLANPSEISEDVIALVLVRLQRQYESSLKSTPPYRQCYRRKAEFATTGQWKTEDLLSFIKLMNPRVVKTLLTTENLFPPGFAHCDGLVIGNVAAARVVQDLAKPSIWEPILGKGKERNALADVVVPSTVDQNKLATMEMPEWSEIAKHPAHTGAEPVPEGLPKLIQTGLIEYGLTTNAEDPNSAVVLTLQYPGSAEGVLTDPRKAGCMGVFCKSLAEPFFDTLRTKQALGYVVSLQNRGLVNRTEVHFICQSQKPSSFVLSRALEFLREKLAGGEGQPPQYLTEEEFENFKAGYMVVLGETPKDLVKLHSIFSHEIWSRRLSFDWRDRQIKELKNLSFEEWNKEIHTILKDSYLLAVCLDPETKKDELLLSHSLIQPAWREASDWTINKDAHLSLHKARAAKKDLSVPPPSLV